jgi:TatD DNase family protein
MMLTDAHAHLDKYGEDDLTAVLRTIEVERILTVAVSVDGDSFRRTEAIANRCPLVVPAFGIHPSEAEEFLRPDVDIEQLSRRSPVIGEIGLDHRFVEDTTRYPLQREVFAAFLGLAGEQRKIVNVHCAGAEIETADMLRAHRADRVIIHWYAGPMEQLDDLIAQGYMFTVGVEVLHSAHVRDVARAIPTDQLLTETDNPGGVRWITGQSGFPTLIRDVVGELARVRATSAESIVGNVHDNLGRLFVNDPHLAPWEALLSSDRGRTN